MCHSIISASSQDQGIKLQQEKDELQINCEKKVVCSFGKTDPPSSIVSVITLKQSWTKLLRSSRDQSLGVTCSFWSPLFRFYVWSRKIRTVINR